MSRKKNLTQNDIATHERMIAHAFPKVTAYGNLEEAERLALSTDWIFTFESIATGTTLWAVAASPDLMVGKRSVTVVREGKGGA